MYILIAVLIFALVAYGLYFIMNTTKNQNPVTTNGTKNTAKVIEKDGYRFEYKYVGENKWEYTLTGSLPTPCNDWKKNVLVMESYPEQVSVNVEILQPEKDVMCAQVITPVEAKDVVMVSEGATFNLNVKIQSE